VTDAPRYGDPGSQPGGQQQPQYSAAPYQQQYGVAGQAGGQPPYGDLGGQPPYGGPVAPQPKKVNGFGIAALIIGIVAIVVAFIPIIGLGAIFLGLIAIGLGIAGIAVKSVRHKKGAAITGMILGVLAGILSVVMSFVYAAALVGWAQTQATTIPDFTSDPFPVETNGGTMPSESASTGGPAASGTYEIVITATSTAKYTILTSVTDDKGNAVGVDAQSDFSGDYRFTSTVTMTGSSDDRSMAGVVLTSSDSNATISCEVTVNGVSKDKQSSTGFTVCNATPIKP